MSDRGNLWIILALLAGVSFAFNNFFLGSLSIHGILAVVYVNIPAFFCFLTIYLINIIRNKIMHGFYWSKDISIFYKDDGSFDWFNLMGVFAMAFAKLSGFCLVVMTFSYAMEANMNLGVITVIFNFTCISDSILFYFVFHEKLTRG